MTTADSDKTLKEAEHRRERRSVKVRLEVHDDLLPTKAFGNPWASEKDGKQWLAEPSPKLMRK